MSETHLLFTPTKLGDLDVKNRVVMAPMTRSRAPGNLPNQLMATYYGQRAEAGLIVTEGTAPTADGLGYARIPGLFSGEQVAGWRDVTAAVMSCIFAFSMTGLVLAPHLPFAALRGESRYRRLERMVYIWIIVFVGVALTWEIPWAILHERIAVSRDQLWAYTWWAYIDGGDLRYINPNWLVFFIETWADTNGILSAFALYAWFKSGHPEDFHRGPAMLLTAAGVANTVDPVGGSYVIEELTDRIEREAVAMEARGPHHRRLPRRSAVSRSRQRRPHSVSVTRRPSAPLSMP